jgi:hypothetical protein
MIKVAELERRLDEIPNSEAYERRIAELEVLLDEQEQKQHKPKGTLTAIGDIAIYLFVPLMLLLLAHALITIVFLILNIIMNMNLPYALLDAWTKPLSITTYGESNIENNYLLST